MKNKIVKLFLFSAGLVVYAATYMATTVKDPFCPDLTYKKDSTINAELSKKSLFISHGIWGKACDTLWITVKDSAGADYNFYADAGCAAARTAELKLKGVIVVKMDTLMFKRDTILRKSCP